jgi:DNA-binding FadR family transcriptional regulator
MIAPETRRVLKETLALIDYHRLGPGDRLPSERDLAEKFTVGRGAVREALTVLETVRMLERRPNSGFYLRDRSRDLSLDALVLFSDFGIPLSEGDVRNAVEMRRILEVQAVGLACQRRQAADVDRLRALLDDSEATLAADGSLAELDAAFHLAVVAATHNDVFFRVVNSFYLLSRQRREVYFQDPRQGRRSHAQHREIFAAIERGDAGAGVGLLERHLQGVETYWLSTLATGAPARGGR